MSNFSALIVGFGSDIPNAASNLLAACDISGKAINLSWTDNSDNELSFKIYRSTNGIDFYYLNAVNAGIITYSDITSISGQNYWFRVTAYNVAGESSYTQVGPISCIWPPNAPSNLIVSYGTNQAILSWLDNSNNEDGFRIEKKIGTGSWAEIATVQTGITIYTAAITKWSTFYFRVRAYNSAGNSSYSNELLVLLADYIPRMRRISHHRRNL